MSICVEHHFDFLSFESARAHTHLDAITVRNAPGEVFRASFNALWDRDRVFDSFVVLKKYRKELSLKKKDFRPIDLNSRIRWFNWYRYVNSFFGEPSPSQSATFGSVFRSYFRIWRNRYTTGSSRLFCWCFMVIFRLIVIPLTVSQFVFIFQDLFADCFVGVEMCALSRGFDFLFGRERQGKMVQRKKSRGHTRRLEFGLAKRVDTTSGREKTWAFRFPSYPFCRYIFVPSLSTLICTESVCIFFHEILLLLPELFLKGCEGHRCFFLSRTLFSTVQLSFAGPPSVACFLASRPFLYIP